MWGGCVRRRRTRSICSTGNCTNTMLISGSIFKICRRFGIGVGRRISASLVLRRLLRKGNLAASYLRILSRAFSGRVADQHPFAHDEESFCWGVVQLVGRCTVNADGGGSNPPAPATSNRSERLQTFCAGRACSYCLT